MTRAGRVRAAGAAALALALTGACSAVGLPAAPRTPAPVQASWSGCEAVGAFSDDHGQAPAGVGGVPSGFVARSAVLCDAGERLNDRGDTVGVELERTASDIGPLLTYLGQPDERPSGGACTADGWVRPSLFLTDDAGRYVAPAIPVDACGKPLGWDQHRERLPWTVLSYTDTVVGGGAVVESAEVKRSGCSTAWKAVIGAYAASSHHRPGRFTEDPFGGQPLRVCVYEVPTSERGRDTPSGDFVSGRTLAVGERSAVLAALVAAPATTPSCGTAGARFATVSPVDGGPFLHVELDGCRRVVADADETPVVRAGDDLRSLLGG